jgi:hypothetical protein
MRLLTVLLVLGVGSCTRGNPSFGASDTEGGDAGQDSSADPSGDPSASTASTAGSADDANPGDDSGGASISATSPLETSVTDSDTAVDTGEPVRDCCEKHDRPGCHDDAVESCVCDVIKSCCDQAWESACVEKGITHCGARCEPPSTSDTGSGDASTTGAPGESSTGSSGGAMESSTGMPISCCNLDVEQIGCASDPRVEACVCENMSTCCTDVWSEECVNMATGECNAVC